MGASAKAIGSAILSLFIQVSSLIWAKGKNINIVSTDFAMLIQAILSKIPIIGGYISLISVEIMVAILSYFIIFIIVAFFITVVRGAAGFILALLAGIFIALVLFGFVKLPIFPKPSI